MEKEEMSIEQALAILGIDCDKSSPYYRLESAESVAKIKKYKEMNSEKDAKDLLGLYGETFLSLEKVDKRGKFDKVYSKLLAHYAKECLNYSVRNDNIPTNIIEKIRLRVEEYSKTDDSGNSGFSSSDISLAMNIKSGVIVLEEPNEKALELISGMNIDKHTPEDDETLELISEPILTPVNTPVVEIIKDQPKVKKEKEFEPAFTLMGSSLSNAGYYTLAWWIYDWITKTENWKEHINDYPNKSDHIILKTLAYYINKNGSVDIRETRNSQFFNIR